MCLALIKAGVSSLALIGILKSNGRCLTANYFSYATMAHTADVSHRKDYLSYMIPSKGLENNEYTH